jgi:hypothetical protein
MLELKTLLNIPKSGIAVFINEETRRVFIFHSTYLIEATIRHLKSIDRRTCSEVMYEDRNKLTFEVVESISNPLALPVRIRYWRDLYLSKGYTLYRPINGVKYTLKIEYDQNSNILVTAVNKRSTGYIIGVFRNLGLAHQWVKNTFKNTEYIIPEYANNALTKSYLETYDIPRFGMSQHRSNV